MAANRGAAEWMQRGKAGVTPIEYWKTQHSGTLGIRGSLCDRGSAQHVGHVFLTQLETVCRALGHVKGGLF